jgi:hypothetical protein
MKSKLTNHDIRVETWLKSGSREDLRVLAKHHGIRRGRDKTSTAINLRHGLAESGHHIVTFDVLLSTH